MKASSGLALIGGAMQFLLLLALLVLVPSSPVDGQVSKLKKQLAAAIAGDDFRAGSVAVDRLVEEGSKKAIEALVDVGLIGEAYALERYIGSKLVGMPAGESFERLCELARKHGNPKARIVLTLVLASRQEKVAYTAVLTNLYDRDDSVALTSVEALVKKDHLGSVSHLIEALSRQEKSGKQEGLVAYEIRKALLGLTAEDFVRADDWRNWWGPREANFKKPEPGTVTRSGMTSVRKDPPAFFGMEVAAKRVLFLLDVSGSMEIRDPMPENPGDGDTKPGGTHVGPKPAEPEPAEAPESRMRLRRVQKELIVTIDKLSADTQFNIVTFNHQIHMFHGKTLVSANSKNKRKAIAFIRNFNAQGETWTDDALEESFGFSDLRAIFVLSDGAPRRANTLLSVEPILEWVREANRFKRIRINTVGFKQAGKSLRAFMRKLARQNNGEYKELR